MPGRRERCLHVRHGDTQRLGHVLYGESTRNPEEEYLKAEARKLVEDPADRTEAALRLVRHHGLRLFSRDQVGIQQPDLAVTAPGASVSADIECGRTQVCHRRRTRQAA